MKELRPPGERRCGRQAYKGIDAARGRFAHPKPMLPAENGERLRGQGDPLELPSLLRPGGRGLFHVAIPAGQAGLGLRAHCTMGARKSISVEGSLESSQGGIQASLLGAAKDILAVVSFAESELLAEFVGSGVHLESEKSNTSTSKDKANAV